MRKYAREIVFCRIYEYILNGECPAEPDMGLFEEKNLTDDDKKYIDEIFGGVTRHFEQISRIVEQYSKTFALERLLKTDLAALALAIYELDYTDTPSAVCVNEAVEIAKRYSSEKSAGFVNGLLAAYIKNKGE